jgi:hypothetical protein
MNCLQLPVDSLFLGAFGLVQKKRFSGLLPKMIKYFALPM